MVEEFPLLNYGKSVQLDCIVTSGNPPPTITWLNEERTPVTQFNKFPVHQVINDNLARLIILNFKLENQGLFFN